MKELRYKKAFFGLIKVPDGWKSLGEKKGWKEGMSSVYSLHEFCRSKVHVGKSNNGELFTYCPLCKIITYDKK